MCAAAAPVSAQKSENIYGVANRVALGVGVGTEGIGIDAATCFTKYLSARVGVNFMPDFNMKTDVDVEYRTEISDEQLTFSDNMKVKGSMGRTTFDVKLDCYPFPNSSSFFVTAGFSFGGSKIIKVTGHSDEVARLYAEHEVEAKELGIKIDEYNVPIDENGDVEAGVKVSGFRPYFGLGFGRLIPKKRVGFRFEMGVQVHGKPKVYADGYTDAELRSIINENADDDITKIMDKITVYPVMKLSLRGRIL